MNNISEIYLDIKSIVISNGFAREIDWQSSIDFNQVSPSDFLRESAWVILSTGMRESIIRNKFKYLTQVFFNWNYKKIIKKKKLCSKNALKIFNHSIKIKSIINIAELLKENDFNFIKDKINEEGIDFLKTLPFIGPTTSYHLAKNIGFDVVKPDRHLLRISEVLGFYSPLELCKSINETLGDKLSVIDIVLWRFATINPDYLKYFH